MPDLCHLHSDAGDPQTDIGEKYIMTINILHLYPREMNLYGDHGNVLALKQRALWRGFDVKVIEHHVGDPIPKDIDTVIVVYNKELFDKYTARLYNSKDTLIFHIRGDYNELYDICVCIVRVYYGSSVLSVSG